MAISAVNKNGKWYVPRSLERLESKIGAGNRIEIQVSQWMKYPFLAAAGFSPRAQGIAARLENRIQNINNTTDQLSLMPDGFNLAVRNASRFYNRLMAATFAFSAGFIVFDNIFTNLDGRLGRLVFDTVFASLPTAVALGLGHLRKGARIDAMLSAEALMKANEQIQTERKLLAKAAVDEEIIQRLGMIVHDLRNYLAQIIMGSELGKSVAIAANIKKRLSDILALAEGISAQDDQKNILKNSVEEMLVMLDKRNPDELFATIFEAARNMLEMVTDLLNLSKPVILSDIPSSLKHCIDNTVKIFKGDRKVSNKKIKLDVRYCSVGLELRFDEGKLKQTLLNLLSNAADALGQGGTIIVSLRRKTIEKPFPGAFGTVSQGEYITIEVEDDGPGILPEMLPKIFEFGQSTKKNQRGSGIGLAIVEKAVRGHGGNITVETRYKQEPGGTIFTIFLPV